LAIADLDDKDEDETKDNLERDNPENIINDDVNTDNENVCGYQPYDLRPRENLQRPYRYTNYVLNASDETLGTYNECVKGPDKVKQLKAINEEKRILKTKQNLGICKSRGCYWEKLLSSR
jgi:hypothetical protein